MPWYIRATFVLIALALIAASAAVSSATGWHMSAVLWEQYLYVGIGIVAIIAAVGGGLGAAWAWRNGRYTVALLSLALLSMGEIYSLRMELRFWTVSQGDATAGRAAKAEDRGDIKTQINLIDQQLAWYPKYKSQIEAQAAVDGWKASHPKTLASYCTSASKSARTICANGMVANSELATAMAVADLKAKRDRLAAQKSAAPVIAAHAMPEATWLAKHLPLTEGGAIDWLMVAGLAFLMLGRTVALPLAFLPVPEQPKSDDDDGAADWRDYDQTNVVPLFAIADAIDAMPDPDAADRTAAPSDAMLPPKPEPEPSPAAEPDTRAAVLDMLAERNNIADFVVDVIQHQGDQMYLFSDLYRLYHEWSQARRHEIVGDKNFAHQLITMGFQRFRRHKNKAVHYWIGLNKPPAEVQGELELQTAA